MTAWLRPPLVLSPGEPISTNPEGSRQLSLTDPTKSTPSGELCQSQPGDTPAKLIDPVKRRLSGPDPSPNLTASELYARIPKP